jgi:hypothetical protein
MCACQFGSLLDLELLQTLDISGQTQKLPLGNAQGPAPFR